MHNQLPPYCDGVTLNLEQLLQYKSHTIHWLPPAKSLWSQLSGQHQSRQKGRGMDFSEVRQYQAGDDIRNIDWRVTARTGKAHTKLYSEEREQPVILYLDVNSTMHFGSQLLLKSVQMAHMASLLAWLTVAKKDRIGAIISTGEHFIECRPTARNSGPLQILQTLIEQHQLTLQQSSQPLDSSQSMTEGLNRLHRLSPKGSEIIILSDFLHYQASDKMSLAQLRRHNRVRLIHCFDPLEQGETRFRGQKEISDGKNNQWFNFGSSNSRKAIKQAFEHEQNRLSQDCLSLAIPYHSLSSATPLLSQIFGQHS
ncbi:cytosolic protein [Vibrio sp. 10N.286.49.B3]|uniref:DUF58 domain-containing protein n=1 Tax=Vibrio sp. 10N.286.49.B3 TaxID=1880855 RepID=UPI000C8609A3|nr:DUF58 domain-containing protein [Vibrio sp. 10N.286.49.B3]PMH43163.1 cytosolic protein [Vibrio sp. 10N.286.49.B3]